MQKDCLIHIAQLLRKQCEFVSDSSHVHTFAVLLSYLITTFLIKTFFFNHNFLPADK